MARSYREMNWFRESSYHKWMVKEGVPIHEGHGVTDVHALELGDWERMGGRGAFIDLMGMEGLTGMYVAEIPAGGTLRPERHMYDELIYILSGRGSMRLWSGQREDPGDRSTVVEWEAGALFAPPCNTWHQLYNLSGDEPVRFLGVTIAPIVMDVYHNTRFVFDCDFTFDDRFDGRPDFFDQTEPSWFEPQRAWLWETNLIPDARGPVLKEGSSMGGGGWGMSYQMGSNILVGHIAEWSVGRYRKAHYHGGGAIVLITAGKGYTLLWPKEVGIRPFETGHGSEVVRVDWHEGSVVSPPSGWFHQHFNTGPTKVRQVALRLGSKRFGVQFHDIGVREGQQVSVMDNGTMIEYEDEDPEISRLYQAELAKTGVEYQMEPVLR